MLLTLKRTKEDNESTLGELYIGDKFQCYTLEDQRQAVKIAGETRIPNTDGKDPYALELKTYGGFHNRYKEQFKWHKGMFRLVNVPEFTDILIHMGNTDDHTAGCILVGDVPGRDDNGNYAVWSSRPAYTKLYAELIAAYERREGLHIAVTDKHIRRAHNAPQT